MKDNSVVKKEFMASDHSCALRKANREINKHTRLLSLDLEPIEETENTD